MLVIRMQRTGRKGHAQFRVVVQDSRRTPTSGKIVAALGSYNPHAKTTTLDKEKAELFLKNGAQPSDRVIRLLKSEGVKLPNWVKEPTKGERKLRNPEKLRKNRPAEEKVVSEKTDEPKVEAPTETEVVAAEDVKTDEPDTTEEKTEETATEA